MATFQMEVPDDQVALIGQAFAQQYQWDTPTGDDGAALTGAALVAAQIEMVRKQIMSYINDIVKANMVWQHQQAQPDIPDTPVVMT